MRLNQFALLFASLLVTAQLGAQAPSAVSSDPFSAYTTCRMQGGPEVVEVSPLASGIQERTVDTRKGPAQIAMLDGRRIMFAYPGEDFYANTKVETLQPGAYTQSKANLIANFDYLLASGDNSRNYVLAPKLNGFEVYGLDRAKREGGVLGVYLLLDDPTRTAVTIYFLNQEQAHFRDLTEYAKLRDQFLANFTGCVRRHLATKQ